MLYRGFKAPTGVLYQTSRFALYCRRIFLITACLAPAAIAQGEVISEQRSEPLILASAGSVSGGRVQSPIEPAKGGDDAARASLRLFEAQGTGIKVQGLTLARTELNGRDQFAAQDGHALSWSDVSSEWMAGVDVHKLPDASMIEGGIGGVMNITTHLPLQSSAPKRGFTLSTQTGRVNNHSSPELSYLQRHRWKTGVGEVGMLVNVVGVERQRLTDRISVEPFIRRDDLAEHDVFMPRGISWQRTVHEQQQRTLAAVLQWQPSSALNLYWQSLRSHYRLHDDEIGAGLNDSDTGLIAQENTELTLSRDGVFEHGHLWSQSWRGDMPGQGVRLNGTQRMANRASQTWDNSLTFTLVPDAPWALRGELQHVDSRTETLDFTVYTSTFVTDFELDLRGEYPTFNVGPESHLRDPSQYFWNAAMDHLKDNRAELFAGRLDFAYQLSRGGWLSAWRMGARAHREEFNTLDSGYNWGSLSDIWNMPLKHLDTYAPEQIRSVELLDFFGTEGPTPQFYLPIPELVDDFAAASALLSDIKSGPVEEGWRPDSFAEEDHNWLQRDVHALYGMLQFDQEKTWLGPTNGHVGVRVVRSYTQSLGHGEFELLEDDTSTLDPNDLAFGNGARFAINQKNQDIHLLPSAFVQFSLRPRVTWQLAASRTVARPNASQLRSYAEIHAETETLTLENGDSQALVKRWLGRTGNPTLQPIVADQFDTAMQWRLNKHGQVYGALFHKTLHNSIVTRVEKESHTNAEQTREVEIERVRNVAGAYLQGSELGLSQKLGFLPGALRNVALEATYTYINSRSGDTGAPVALPLEGLSENNFTVTGTYQNQYLKLTFAYRWRDDYLLSAIDVDTNRPTWHAPTERLDASLALRLGANVQLGVEAQNLTNTTQIRALGPFVDSSGQVDERRYHNQWQRHERQWRLVLRGSF